MIMKFQKITTNSIKAQLIGELEPLRKSRLTLSDPNAIVKTNIVMLR